MIGGGQIKWGRLLLKGQAEDMNRAWDERGRPLRFFGISVCAEIVSFTNGKEIKLTAEPMEGAVNTKQEGNQIWNDLN